MHKTVVHEDDDTCTEHVLIKIFGNIHDPIASAAIE